MGVAVSLSWFCPDEFRCNGRIMAPTHRRRLARVQGQNSRDTHCPSFNVNVGLIQASDVELRFHKTNGSPTPPSGLLITQSTYITISNTLSKWYHLQIRSHLNDHILLQCLKISQRSNGLRSLRKLEDLLNTSKFQVRLDTASTSLDS